MADSINKLQSFCLNESIPDSGKTVFKKREEVEDRKYFVQSNDGDPELLFYIPFNCQVDIKNMTMIGGENDSSPIHIKLYVNEDNPDFSLLETSNCAQEFETYENPDGQMTYELKPRKFKSVTSITLIVAKNRGADFSKIYMINFTGTRTKVRIMI